MQPLEGIRVLEWGVFHAGPGGTAILGDLGAEVIKIEQPGGGDPMRNIQRIGRISFHMPNVGSLWNEGTNRNKKSITIDLSKEKGREIAYRLVGKSDVFLTNLRRRTVKSMKMEYSDLRQINPQLIYAGVSAYGPDGPDSDFGGFDPQGQARSGMMFSVGEEGMPPLVSQFGIFDQATAIMASHQILTALLARERFGIGQEVQVSILSTSIYLLYMNVLTALVGGFEVPRYERPKENAMRNYYRCSDDRWLMLTLPANRQQQQWATVCQVLGHPELINDPRFDTDEQRFANTEELVNVFDQIFITRPRDEWLHALREHDLICCQVNRLSELVDDPQIMQNGYIDDFEHPILGKIKIPGYPVHFSESRVGTRSMAPRLGEHTEEVLTEIGGYTNDEVAQLQEDGVI